MRNPRNSEPRGRVRCRWFRAALVAVPLLSGCFFDLAELVPPGGGAGGDGGSGLGGSISVGGAGAGGSLPGGAGNDGDPCPPNQKSCNGVCEPMSPENGCGNDSCVSCVIPPNAVVACHVDSGECLVESCETGFGDCNGDTVGDRGEVDGDGCEYSFGTLSGFSEPLDVPFQRIVLDENRNDWQGIPAYALDQTCRDCSRDDFLAPIVAQNEPPPPADLRAYFRVAWDQDFFYVLGEAYDDHVFDAGSSLNDVGCQDQAPLGGALCEDGFSLFFDGRNDGGTANDDHRVFIGLGGKFFAPAQGQPPPNTVAVRVLPGSPQCYRMEARFDWKYIVGTLGGQGVPGSFPPIGGQSYGFDVAVSDWDSSLEDQSVMQRQSQLFWKNPGERYQFREGDIGTMRLSGGPDAGVGP